MNPSYSAQILDLIRSDGFLRATFGGPPRGKKDSQIRRAVIRRILLGGQPQLHVSRFDARKDRTTNYPLAELDQALADILAIGFANVHIVMTDEQIDLRLTKKGEVLIGRKAAATQVPETHNRAKNLPLPEGHADTLLQAMGILDRNGRVRPTMRPKFTQINEFLKLLDHILPEALPASTSASGLPLKILDCGCGASHLTLAVHHYLNAIKQIPAEVLGIDINDEVIRAARDRAADLHCTGLDFQKSPIGAPLDIQPDIVLALHACDTATDDALAQAIRSHARLILAVPCCHKDLNSRIDIAALRPIHRHGILHQRQADLITDAFRALILRIMGYRTEVIEFISPEHTARNLMIRAVKATPPGDPQFVAEYVAFRQFTGVTPHLESILAELLPVPPHPPALRPQPA